MSERALLASTYGKEPTTLSAQLVDYDRSARLRRAASIGLPLLGGAVLSLFVPAWHFVGVPGFLIASVVFGLRRLREHASLEALTGECPACRSEQGFPAQGALELPITLRCPGCGEFLKLEAV